MKTAGPSVLDIGIEGMSCGHCVARVKEALGAIPGVEVIGVEVGSARVAVADSTVAEAALGAIEEAGFPARIAQPAKARGGGCCGGGQGSSCCG